jgi:hypothetical protein
VCAGNIQGIPTEYVACVAVGRYLFVVQPLATKLFFHIAEVEVLSVSPFENCLAAADERLALGIGGNGGVHGEGIDTVGLPAYGTQDDMRKQVMEYLTTVGACKGFAECQALDDYGLQKRCEAYMGPALMSDGSGPFGNSLRSPSGNHKLVMQEDGNLVLHTVPGGSSIWDARTDGVDPAAKPHRAVLQPDGNFVRFDRNFNLGSWESTGTSDSSFSRKVRVAVTDAGKIVVKDDASGVVIKTY